MRKSRRLLQMIKQHIGSRHCFKAVHTMYLLVVTAMQGALGLASAQQGANVVRIKAVQKGRVSQWSEDKDELFKQQTLSR